MVYSGKPSSGCARCKERRKKCDETRPSCTNCQKLGRPCPGFPDALDLMFKNETDRVASKAMGTNKRRKGGKKRANPIDAKDSRTPQSSSSDSLPDRRRGSGNLLELDDKGALDFVPKPGMHDLPDDLSWLQDWDPTANMKFNPSIERQATSFFFEHFVLAPKSKEASRGFLEVLLPMYKATPMNSPLSMATEALAVRTAANFPGGKHLVHHAETLYGRAMKSVQRAIEDPVQATSDETLLSILLFSLYESVTSSHVDNWSKHIKGAVSIVKSRGRAQFTNPQSLLLFRSTRMQMLTNAITRGEEIEKFPGPNGWLSDQNDETSNCLIEYSIRLPGVMARAKELLVLDQTPVSTASVNELLRDAYNLQHELFDWELNMPAEYGYKSTYHSAPSGDETSDSEIIRCEVWRPGSVHTYRDVQVASIRNNNRVSQLLCSSIVIDCLKWLDPEGYMDDRRYKAAVYRIRYLVDDIAASVPFHLGYQVAEEDPPSAKEPPKPAVNFTGGYFLIWPLLISSSIAAVPVLQRKWLRGKLHLIARRYGLGQSDIARARPGGVWSVGGSDPNNAQDETTRKDKGIGEETWKIRTRVPTLDR